MCSFNYKYVLVLSAVKGMYGRAFGKTSSGFMEKKKELLLWQPCVPLIIMIGLKMILSLQL